MNCCCNHFHLCRDGPHPVSIRPPLLSFNSPCRMQNVCCMVGHTTRRSARFVVRKKQRLTPPLCPTCPSGDGRFTPRSNIFWVTGATPQGTKTLKLIAECGQKVVSTVRSNSRENMTMVTTISAAGDVLFPLIIFKGQRVQAAWMDETKGPENARYAATESSFMQGSVFVEYLKDFHNQLEERGLLDGKPHVLVLDGHASHVNFDVIKLAKTLNIVLFQLPSHTSHITQPLDVAAFGSFKQQMTKVLTRFPMEHGGRTPLKSDMVGIIGEAFRSSFSKEQNIASFAAAGLWPVNMEKAMGRLQGCGKVFLVCC